MSFFFFKQEKVYLESNRGRRNGLRKQVTGAETSWSLGERWVKVTSWGQGDMVGRDGKGAGVLPRG